MVEFLHKDAKAHIKAISGCIRMKQPLQSNEFQIIPYSTEWMQWKMSIFHSTKRVETFGGPTWSDPIISIKNSTCWMELF